LVTKTLLSSLTIAGLVSIFEATFTGDFGVRAVAEPEYGQSGRFDDYARVKAYAEAIPNLPKPDNARETVFSGTGQFLPIAKSHIPISN
jgi:hypothetical protein